MSKFKEYIETKQKYEDIKKELSKARVEFERTIPYKRLSEGYYYISEGNEVRESRWRGTPDQLRQYECNNVFEDLTEAQKEQLKRKVIADVARFRKECYGDWRPDWKDLKQEKYTIVNDGQYLYTHKTTIDTFSIFGYFKYENECKKAIELFGDDLEKMLNHE